MSTLAPSARAPRPLGGLSALNGTMPEWARRVERRPPLAFVDSCLRGVGQVVFMNNPVTGLAIVVGMFIASPWLGVAGVIGLVVSTVTAIVLGIDRSAIRAGLYGFNGVLVGAALSLFLEPSWHRTVIGWIIAVSALSTVLMASLATVFLSAWRVPPFTLPFNFATLLFLLAALGLAHGHLGELIDPHAPAVLGPAVVSSTLRAAIGGETASNVGGLVNGIFRGIGQLFFANSLTAGILIIAGIAVCSRIAAIFALIGSFVGLLTGLILGADGVALYNGLWGFNSFDAALAVGGVFYVLTWRSGLLAVACAISTALLFGAIASFFAPWGLPALTLPFCFGTLAFVLMKYRSKRFVPVEAEDITTPEEHRRRMLASLARAPGAGTMSAGPGPGRHDPVGHTE